ncbi:Protein of unknown function DUF4012 [Candidatus Nanopelagicaceae bacterium]
MRVKFGLVILAMLLFLSASSFQGLKSFIDIRDFRNQLTSTNDVKTLQNQSLRIEKDISRILSISNLPVLKNALDLLDLNFGKIKPELSALILSAPLILGNDRPKKYLVAFQNSAEARGTGGILGAFAIVELDKGSFKVLRTGSNAGLVWRKEVPIKLPAEFAKLYGKNPAIFQNSNLSPHFPYGAEIWVGLWKLQFGEQLDGVIAIDPSALSYVLESTGPVTLKSGEVITSENVVSETLQKAYKRFEKDNNARKQYLVDIMNAAAAQVTSGQYSKIGMAKAIKRGILENRILMYSNDQSVEIKLASTRLGGYLSTEPNNEFRVVVQNIDAGKLDYYLKKSVVVESQSCKNPNQTQVRVKVTNTLKSAAGLPAYVLTRADKNPPADLVSGQHRFKLFIYGPTESKLVSVSRDIRTNGLGGASTERGRPIYVADVDLKPGQSENLLANFAGGVGRISFVDQPLVIPTELAIKGGC